MPLNDLLDDLDLAQYRALLDWLWVHTYSVTRANIKAWRRSQLLPID